MPKFTNYVKFVSDHFLLYVKFILVIITVVFFLEKNLSKIFFLLPQPKIRVLVAVYTDETLSYVPIYAPPR